MRLVPSEIVLANIAGVRRGCAQVSAVGGSDNILNLKLQSKITIKTKGGSSEQNTDHNTPLFNRVAINVIKTLMLISLKFA